MRAWLLVSMALVMAACDDSPAANVAAPEAGDRPPVQVLTADQRSELDACERAYINRFGSPMMSAQASAACNTAYLDLPKDSVPAKYAKAMYDAAEARFWSDDKERKRLEDKAHDLAVAQFTSDRASGRLANE